VKGDIHHDSLSGLVRMRDA